MIKTNKLIILISLLRPDLIIDDFLSNVNEHCGTIFRRRYNNNIDHIVYSSNNISSVYKNLINYVNANRLIKSNIHKSKFQIRSLAEVQHNTHNFTQSPSVNSVNNYERTTNINQPSLRRLFFFQYNGDDTPNNLHEDEKANATLHSKDTISSKDRKNAIKESYLWVLNYRNCGKWMTSFFSNERNCVSCGSFAVIGRKMAFAFLEIMFLLVCYRQVSKQVDKIRSNFLRIYGYIFVLLCSMTSLILYQLNNSLLSFIASLGTIWFYVGSFWSADCFLTTGLSYNVHVYFVDYCLCYASLLLFSLVVYFILFVQYFQFRKIRVRLWNLLQQRYLISEQIMQKLRDPEYRKLRFFKRNQRHSDSINQFRLLVEKLNVFDNETKQLVREILPADAVQMRNILFYMFQKRDLEFVLNRMNEFRTLNCQIITIKYELRSKSLAIPYYVRPGKNKSKQRFFYVIATFVPVWVAWFGLYSQKISYLTAAILNCELYDSSRLQFCTYVVNTNRLQLLLAKIFVTLITIANYLLLMTLLALLRNHEKKAKDLMRTTLTFEQFSAKHTHYETKGLTSYNHFFGNGVRSQDLSVFCSRVMLHGTFSIAPYIFYVNDIVPSDTLNPALRIYYIFVSTRCICIAFTSRIYAGFTRSDYFFIFLQSAAVLLQCLFLLKLRRDPSKVLYARLTEFVVYFHVIAVLLSIIMALWNFLSDKAKEVKAKSLSDYTTVSWFYRKVLTIQKFITRYTTFQIGVNLKNGTIQVFRNRTFMNRFYYNSNAGDLTVALNAALNLLLKRHYKTILHLSTVKALFVLFIQYQNLHQNEATVSVHNYYRFLESISPDNDDTLKTGHGTLRTTSFATMQSKNTALDAEAFSKEYYEKLIHEWINNRLTVNDSYGNYDMRACDVFFSKSVDLRLDLELLLHEEMLLELEVKRQMLQLAYYYQSDQKHAIEYKLDHTELINIIEKFQLLPKDYFMEFDFIYNTLLHLDSNFKIYKFNKVRLLLERIEAIERSEKAVSLNITGHTIARYIDLLTKIEIQKEIIQKSVQDLYNTQVEAFEKYSSHNNKDDTVKFLLQYLKYTKEPINIKTCLLDYQSRYELKETATVSENITRLKSIGDKDRIRYKSIIIKRDTNSNFISNNADQSLDSLSFKN